MKVAFYLFFLVFIHYTVYAIEIDDSSSNISVTKSVSLYVDKSSELSKKEIFTKEFIPNTTEILDFGIMPDTAVWIKFSLKNISNKPIKKLLEYANQETETLYFYDGNRTIKEGMFFHAPTRESINPTFSIMLKPHEERTYLVRASCKISTLIVKLTLWNEKDFITYDHKHKTIIFIFLTIIATLLIYNIMLFIFTRDIIYFYYIAYLLAVLFFESIYLGALQLYLLSNELSQFFTKATIGYIVALVVPMILFTKAFLNTQRFTRIDNFLNLYLYSLPFIAVLSYDNFLFDLNVMLIFFPLAFLMILAAFYALKEGTKEARIYLLGWSFVIISLTLSVLQSLGGYNVFEDFRYINELAFSLEALIFSIALAYRIKRLSEEKSRLNEELISVQKRKQDELEELVNVKTQDLQESLEEKEILYKELNHRVKNNLQMVLSLIKLQITKAKLSDTKEALKTTSNRIYSISKLYELLYLSEKKNFLSTKSYFENIVKTVQANFDKSVNITYDVRHDIETQNAIYCGLILNELVTNSFKHAFKESGEIAISSYKNGELTCLCVEDNGLGYQEETQDSLGLTIVKTLCEKQLNAELIIENINGMKYTILFNEAEKSNEA